MKTQSDFSKGETAADFCARGAAGALALLLNAEITESGSIARRRGLTGVADLPGAAVLASFGAEYLLAITASAVRVYKNNAPVQTLAVSWGVADIAEIRWAERMDEMVFTHRDMRPKVLRKSGAAFAIADFQFETNANWTPIIPFMHYPDTDGITLTLSAHSNGTNWATITASAAMFGAGCVGGQIKCIGMILTITDFISETKVVAYGPNSFAMPSAAVRDWTESAWSDWRGWPASAAFFQDRLVFGGCRAWPCGLWFSKTGKHRNFDAGTGLDDEAIFITLMSDAQQKIQNCAAGRDLIVMTDSGEWAVSANPLTPSSISARQHSSIGTAAERFVQPQKIGAGTAFASKDGGVAEIALDELGENYAALDLTLTARHLAASPVSLCWSASRSQLFAVMPDGTMAVMTKVPALGLAAWARFATEGRFASAACVGGEIYAAVKRGDAWSLERFADDSTEDFSFRVESAPLIIDGHHPRRVRVNRASARVEGARHIKLCGHDFYFDAPRGGDISAAVLGTGDSTGPLWAIESSERHPVKIISATSEGNYEL
jgi:hypothetical protein